MLVQIAARWSAILLLLTLFFLPLSAQQTPSPVHPDSFSETSAQPSANRVSSDQNSNDQGSGRSSTQTAPAQVPSTQSTDPQSKPSAGTTQPPANKNQPQSGEAQNQDKDKASDQGKTAGTSNDRLFFALPNFLTISNSGQVPPLTAKQKFSVVARGSFDPVIYPWYALLSGINQASDSEPGYGQGWGSYGKRYVTSFADGTIENFMVGAVFASALHQDPRFYQSGQGSFMHRAGYAVSRTFITRSDSGKREFNFSEIVGSATSAAISTNTYHPTSKIFTTPTGIRYVPSDRTLSNTASVWVSQVGYDTLTIVIKEFWPDIHRAVSHKHKADASAPAK